MDRVQRFPKEGLRPEWLSSQDDPLQRSELIEWLLRRQESFIGSSYYYIREDRGGHVICRMSLTGGCLYSVEIINHTGYGISVEEIGNAAGLPGESPEIPGHCHIDIHIEHKLRNVLMPGQKNGDAIEKIPDRPKFA